MWRDKSRTSSINSGWVMAATAGTLSIQLEKPGNYLLGDSIDQLDNSHIFRSIKLLQLTVLLFLLFVCIPLILFIPYVSILLNNFREILTRTILTSSYTFLYEFLKTLV